MINPTSIQMHASHTRVEFQGLVDRLFSILQLPQRHAGQRLEVKQVITITHSHKQLITLLDRLCVIATGIGLFCQQEMMFIQGLAKPGSENACRCRIEPVVPAP